MAKWLVKSEPAECGIEDFAKAPDGVIPWDGVRNYQARNFLARMAEGDEVFLYHSSCKHVGIAGIARVVTPAYPDPSQFDARSPYFDPKSNPEKPRWSAVDLQFEQRISPLLPFRTLTALPPLHDLALVKRGNRLSVMPLEEQHYAAIMRLAADSSR